MEQSLEGTTESLWRSEPAGNELGIERIDPGSRPAFGAELRESERRFRDMLANVNMVAMTLDTTGRITFCNDYLLRLTGWDRESVASANWFDRFIPKADSVKDLFYQTVKSGTIPPHYENPILTRDGRLRGVRWNNTMLRDTEGRVIGVACIGEDVTDRKRIEEAKTALALRNEAFVKALGEIVYDHDLTTDRIEWGGKPERCTGWTIEELGSTGEDWKSRIHPEDAARAAKALTDSVKEPFFTSEYRFRRKDGKYAWVFDRGFVRRDERGRVIRITGIVLDMTQRRQSEEELRARTAFCEALLQSSSDGIIVVDQEGKTILQNRRAVELWKMPGEIAEEIDDEKRLRFAMSLLKEPQAFVDKVNYLYAHPFESSHDEIELIDGRILDRSSAPVTDSSGKYYGRVWTFRDNTERKRTEQRIADELNYNRTILEAAPFGILTYRATGENISANETAARLLGARPEQLASLNFRELQGWKAAGVLDIAERVLATGREEEVEKEFVTSFAKRVWLSIRLVPFHYSGQQHLLTMFTDIEGRKRSEAALRESQLRFKQLAENIEEVFWMRDSITNEVLYISPAYERIWGRPIENLKVNPQAWLEGIHPEDRGRVRSTAIRRSTDGNYNESYRVVRPDGSIRWIQDRGFPIRDEAGQVYRIVGLAADWTTRRQLEEQFRQAQKMEAIGTLAGGIAHDFNNILGAIIGYTELAKLGLEETSETRTNLDAVIQAAGRATSLVKQILAFSRKQPQERKIIQLRHMVSEGLKLLRATIPTTIEFETSLPSSTHPVLADATQIHQIVMNLATNAWHAMKERPGKLGARLENVEVDSAMAAEHPELRPGKYVRLSISDTGHGMDAATAQRIFEPFFTTKPVGEGTGLGLAVVHGIMQTHEGAIIVETELGVGTTFGLYFPAHQESAVDGSRAAADIPRGSGERILLVDDEPALANLWEIGLKRLGYVVETHARVADALACIIEKPSDYDLVLSDVAMPGMSGTDFMQEALRIRPDLPIILMTGYSSNLTAETAKSLGAKDLMLKPLTMEIVAQSVHTALYKG